MAEPKDSDREVLTSLPRTRPVRRSPKRGAPATAKPAPEQTAKAAPKSSTKTAPRATAKPAPNAAPKTTPPRRKVPPAGYAAPASRSDDAGGGSGTADMINTTIQAAAELAQIGLTVGRQTLQSMFDRLPKP